MSGSHTYVFDRFRLQTGRHELCRDGKPVALEPKAFAVLTQLLAHEGELLARDTLLDAVWGHRYVTPGVLSRSIAQLRRGLEDDCDHPHYIQTVHALGYRFIAPVRLEGTPATNEAVPSPAASIAPAGVLVAEPEADVHAVSLPVAVLPFVNMSDDPEQAYFSDGITEDIITELSRWHMLAVRSRAASFRYRGVAVDVRQVARELAVRFIVEGSVRRMGDCVRITVQLIDAEAGNHVWAEKYDSSLSQLFAVQDEVVCRIVGTLVGRVQACDAERARRKPPSSLAAYECVLKGNASAMGAARGVCGGNTPVRTGGVAGSGLRPGACVACCDALFALVRRPHRGRRSARRGFRAGNAWRRARSGRKHLPLLACPGASPARRIRPVPAADTARRGTQPPNQWNMADMGMMLNYAGEPEQALDWFARALHVDPYFDPSWYWREYGHRVPAAATQR